MPNQKGFSQILLLLIVLVGIGAAAYVFVIPQIKVRQYQQQVGDLKNQQKNIVEQSDYIPSPEPTPETINQKEVDKAVNAYKNFLAEYEAKYPKPSSLPIPDGLSEELWQVLTKASSDPGDKQYFKVKEYYGDVAIGKISWAEWHMNKINGKWTLVTLGQESPGCKDLQPFMNDLKDWQGLCYTGPGEKLIDGKHPNESYNNY